MSAALVLEQARARGIVLSDSGGKLLYEAPAGHLTSELRKALVAHKPAILDLLSDSRRRMGEAAHMLRQNPGEQHAIVPGAARDGIVSVTLAIRTAIGDILVGELAVPADRWDPFLFLEMMTQGES